MPVAAAVRVSGDAGRSPSSRRRRELADPPPATALACRSVKLCVLVKEVPAASAPRRIDPARGRLDRSGEGALNPFDAHAIEAAVQLRESGALSVDELVAVSMGPRSATQVLHKAVSRGADRAVLLCDAVLAGSDIHGTAYALACVLRREQPDLVLLGQQSADAECYAVAAAVAEHLELPSLTQVSGLRVLDGRLLCERQAEYGYDTVSLELPAVVSVTQDINEPRYPSLQAVMAARRKPLEVLTAEQAGIDASRVGHDNARALCADFTQPPPRAPVQMLEDRDPEATARAIVAWLDERGLLA